MGGIVCDGGPWGLYGLHRLMPLRYFRWVPGVLSIVKRDPSAIANQNGENYVIRHCSSCDVSL